MAEFGGWEMPIQYRGVLEEHPELFNQQGNKYYVLGRLLGTQLAKGRENEAPFLPVDALL